MVRNPHGKQFLIFINDLDSTLTSSIFEICWRMTIPSCSVESTRIRTEKSSREICTNSSNGLKKWQMPFNTGKCVVVHFGYSNKQFDYYMDNQKLDVVKEAKDLGITITCTLKPATQCQQAYAKASRALGLIARTISYKSPEVLLKLYKTLVRPHAEYCVSAWSPYYVKDKALLECIQHRFTRMVPELKSLPYEERLDHLGIWTLEERRNRADLLPVFKLYNEWSSTQFGHLFIISTVTNTRGHTAKTDKPRCHLDLRRSFFSHCVIDR